MCSAINRVIHSADIPQACDGSDAYAQSRRRRAGADSTHLLRETGIECGGRLSKARGFSQESDCLYEVSEVGETQSIGASLRPLRQLAVHMLFDRLTATDPKRTFEKQYDS